MSFQSEDVQKPTPHNFPKGGLRGIWYNMQTFQKFRNISQTCFYHIILTIFLSIFCHLNSLYIKRVYVNNVDSPVGLNRDKADYFN